MEIHPRTVAATYRSMAQDYDRAADTGVMSDEGRHHSRGVADGLRMAAEDMERRADDAFDRILAETEQATGRPFRHPDPTGVDCAEAHEGIDA